MRRQQKENNSQNFQLKRIQNIKNKSIKQNTYNNNSKQKNKQVFKGDYLYNINSILNKLFFVNQLKHILYLNFIINQKINNLPSNQIQDINKPLLIQNQINTKSLNYYQLPNILYSDNCKYNANLIFKQQSNCQSKQIDSSQLFKLIFKTYQSQIISIFLYMQISALIRILFCVLQYNTLIALTQSLNKSYIYALLTGLFFYIFNIFNQNTQVQLTAYLYPKVFAAIIYVLTKKILTLSQYTAKSQNLGKLINVVAIDFSKISSSLQSIFQALHTPITLSIILFLIYQAIGIKGLLCAIILIPAIILQILIGKINAWYTSKISKVRDERVNKITQLIQLIRVIKMYTWESAFIEGIQKIRQKQRFLYIQNSFFLSLRDALANSSVLVAQFVSFYSIYQDDASNLNTSKIFYILMLQGFLTYVFWHSSQGIKTFFQLFVVLGRASDLLSIKNTQMIKLNAEQQQQQIDEASNEKIIVMKNFTALWDKQKQNDYQLHKIRFINLQIKKGVLYGIGGSVGSWKSTLLLSILQQIPYYKGIFKKSSKITFVQQQPVLFSNTIKQNIIFEKQFKQDLYLNCLKYSCLILDLQKLKDRDMTLIGQKGITLSGGQKVRISLARALYSQADTYLLDDPLSALDSKVANQIFKNTIKKYLSKKTIILVSHNINYLKLCDQIIIMSNGIIQKQGTFQQVKNNSIFSLNSNEQRQQQNKQINQQLTQQKQPFNQTKNTLIKQNRQLIKQQTKSSKKEQSINVTFKTYIKYFLFDKRNYIILPITLFFVISTEALKILFIRVLANYQNQINHQNHKNNFQTPNKFWYSLGIVLVIYFIFDFIKSVIFNFVFIVSNSSIHKTMIDKISRSMVLYFDKTPSGQIINKFSNDLGNLDFNLFNVLNNCFSLGTATILLFLNIFQLEFSIMIVCCLVIIFAIYWFNFCIPLILMSKQCELQNKGPILTYINESIQGLLQIKLFSVQSVEDKNLQQLIDNYTRCLISYILAARGFVSPNKIVMSLGFLIIPIIGVYSYKSKFLSIQQYGLIITFLFEAFRKINYVLILSKEIGSSMLSVERVFKICQLQSEGQVHTNYEKYIPSNWSQYSQIQLKNVSLKYSYQLPEVLSGISFKIKAYQKVGIVGRTGAGKSSIIQALLRMYEPSYGSEYFINNYNALNMGLHFLRKQIAIIPQMPILFEGTIRYNLDPLNQKSDQQLINSLQKSRILDYIKTFPELLDTKISKSKQIFSVGQKQLICLSRALLRKSHIIILDEATANIDMKTDELVQQVLKKECNKMTVLTIAHRIKTVFDYDKIIVMNNGNIIQMGHPYQLVERKGLFFQMVNRLGKQSNALIQKMKDNYHFFD